MRRILSAIIAIVLILYALPALAQQPSVAEMVLNRYLATGTASERDLLLLMSQPKEFLAYQKVLKATAPGLEQQALAIRRTVFQRALAKLAVGEGGDTVQAVIALGSWAAELNAGDMDIVVRGGREAAKRLNQLLHEEIEAILRQGGDDVCQAVFSKGARFTVETFEIFVSTLEDFGYDSLRSAFREALEIAAREGQVAGAAHLNKAADSIIRRNLNAQRFAAVQKEYYPGASGQDFVRDYFAKQGKSRTWRVGDNGVLDASWDAGLTADRLTETLIRDLGLSVDSMSNVFKFPVIADELVQWGERSKLGAREQAKGLVRAYEARPGGYFGLLTEQEKRVLEAARILANTPRENQAYIRQALRAQGFATEQAFSIAGEAMLWNLTKASNNEAMRVIVENQKAAIEAAKAGKQVEAQYRRITDYLMSNEQLAGYSKLKPEQLLKLADELPADMAFREEMTALLEFMAEGSEKGTRSAAAMAKRLVKLAYQQKRLSAEATEEAIKAIRAGKGIPADVEDVIAVLRKDLADLASIRAVSPATDSLADCIRTSSLFSKGGLNLTPELEAVIEEISKLGDIELLQLGFKNSEIALLRELNTARAQGARLNKIGEALKKAAPKNYRAVIKGLIAQARKELPANLVFQGPFALWGVYRVALDPSIPEEEQSKRLGEAIYTVFPTAGLVLDGLPMAYIEQTELGDIDAKALTEGVAFAGLEMLGLFHPAIAGSLLAGYATYQVSAFMLQAERDRQFVTALYRALDGNTLKVKDGTRSFDTSGVQVFVDPSTKLPVIIHSAAFQDLYTSRGDVLLDTGEGRKPYDGKLNVAIRDFAKRYVWDTNEDLKTWERAVKRYFPGIDLDRVESWNLNELTEQAATVEKNEFKVGARLVRRYVNQRDLLTESALRHIRGRLFEMQTALKTVEASKKELEAIEKTLDMEKKIVPNAQAEQDSFTGWLWDAATSNVTRLEQISGIWKRYLKTYKEALVVHGRVTKIFESADLSPPTGADLFGLSGVESTDKPKIDAVYQSFQTAFDKAYQEYRGAKGGNPDPKDPFDADAWKRLLSLRMRLFLGEFQKTTQARLAALEKEVGQVLEEVREHYRGAVVLAVSGPTEVEAAKEVSLRVSATKAGKPADDALKNARIEWSVGQAVKNSGITWHFSPLEETVMDITVTATTEVAGRKVVLGSTTHRLTVTTEGKKEPAGGDPKQQAEARYRWLKESVAYLEALKEYDRKSYNAFEKSVTSSIVREFVAQTPPRYEKDFKLPDGPDKTLCGETFGDIRDRLTRFEAECWSALKAGCKTVGTREVTRTVDGKQMKILESVTSCEAPCGKAQSCSNVLKTHTGQLGYANSLQDYVNGKHLSCLGEAGAAHGKHQRELDRKIKELPESLPYKRYPEYAGLNDWKGYLVAVEKTKQEFGLPDTIPSPIVLPWSYSSPCGGGGTAVDTSKLAVTLTARPEKISYKPGDVVNVTAHVTGGKAPYAYAWTGDHAGSGQTVTRAASKPGSHALSVEVKDAAGARGQASIVLKYEGLTAEIAGLTNRIIYGTSLTLRVSVPGLGAAGPTKPPPPGNVDPEEERQCAAWRACLAKAKTDPNILCIAPPDYECWGDTPSTPDETASVRIIWQSDKALDFQPGTSYDGKTDVLFDRMGVIKIWAEIEKKVGEKVYETVGKTDQREVIVVPPKFKMVFNPEKGKGKIGQEVRVTVETDPKTKPDIINYEWSWPESSGRMQYEKNASVIGFVPRDPKPVKLLVAPKTAHDPVPIGGAIEDEYTAGAYAITVAGPRAMGPPPQIWKEGVGLVNAEQQIAVFQNVSMRADIAPEPEKKPLRYQWTVTPGGCTLSNDITQEITVNCSQTGSFQAKVTVKDRDGADLGSGSGSISVTISQQTLNQSAKKAKESQDKNKKTEEAKKKLADAKAKARKGDYDGAIRDAEEAAKLDPANKEAPATAQKLRQEKNTIHQQIGKAMKLMDENRFADAQKELTVASNLNGYYQPVQQANQELGTRWNKYNSEVRDKVYEVRSANEKKDFGKALEIAAAWRASTKLDPYAERELKQQEDWAKQWKAQKEKQIGVLKEAGEKVKNYDYAGALKQYDEGFANGQNIYNGTEPEYKEAVELRSQAFTKNKRLQELIPWVRKAAEDKEYMTVDALQNTLKTADEAIALQPVNEQLKKWRAAIVARAEKTKADNERIAAGRKHLDAARAAENSFLSQDSYVRADSGRWGESIELSMQEYITKAIENYRASIAYIPDKNVEQRINELQTTLEGRKKFLENVRLSKKLLVDADVMAKDARAEQNFDASQQKFAKAIETYQQSLNLYRPSNAETIAKIIHNLDIESKTNAFKKYRADGTALEQQQPVEALVALEKAATFRTYAIHEGEWTQFGGQLQNLRSRVQTAKNLRARGESEQQQGKISQAVASYEASLKLVPDQALADHVKLLKTQLAKGDEKKQSADRLWQEGTNLFNQGQPSDALTKFKESLGYWTDATRTKYVADMETRRSKAVSLREEGAKLQQGNRIPEAIAKYKESLSYWPDTGLSSHIATLEGKLKQDNDTAARKARAKQLRDEGYTLQQKNQLQAAIGKYKESLAVWPDKQLEDHIRQLEAKIASAPASPPATGTPSGSAAPLAGSWTANFNNYRGAFTIRPDGSATLDIGNGVEAITDLRFDASSGRITFTRMLKHVGPQHKQVYTGRLVREGYAEGSFDCTASGKGFPWKIERTAKAGPTTVPATSSTQKPGSSAVETGKILWADAWKSDPGPDGEVVTFALSQSGNRLTGTFQVDVPYTSATGARQKESLRGTIDGTVSGNRVTGNFREGSDKGPTGSFEFTMAAGGNLFTALVRGEDSSDTYTVRRSGSAATSGSVQTIGQTASRSVTAEITNRSKLNAHVFTEGESFGPGNRLAPGEKRKVAVAMKADGSVVFKAGRDGKVMATKTWRGNPGDASRVPVVVFDDTNPYDKLTVTTGLR